MFLVYYILVALFTFWAASTHAATRGKPFVALVSALVMPFALPLIPVIGLVALIYQSVKGKAPKEQPVAPRLEERASVTDHAGKLRNLLDEDPRVRQAVWSLTFMEGTYEQDQGVLKKVEECLAIARQLRGTTGRDVKEVLAEALDA